MPKVLEVCFRRLDRPTIIRTNHVELGKRLAQRHTGKSISVARWVEATVFLQFLENLRSLAVGHESGKYLAQDFFFGGRLERDEDQLLQLYPTMNGF